MRYFYYFFNNSRHDNDLFNNFLNLNSPRYLNNLFNDLLYNFFLRFYSIIVVRYRNCVFFFDKDWYLFFDDMWNFNWYLNRIFLFDDGRFADFYGDMDLFDNFIDDGDIIDFFLNFYDLDK